ncbi:MAG: hypothetical protein RIS35_1165 [Pseudomonadota bacterium]|jgi:hypothetical protein
MDFEAHLVDALPVDADLVDAGTVGPELAHLSSVYLRSPRALSWREPSPEWQLFVLLLPLGSRLSLMANPIFGQLTRTWGLNVRFVGIDRAGLAHDFRNLLSDATLRLIVRLLDAELADDRPLLDTLFAALAREMLTVVGERRPGWGRHLDTGHRLEALQPGTLFAREGRYPDFLTALRAALRDEIIDTQLYGRALRSIDLRELGVEERIAARVEAALDAETLARLSACGAGRHLGAYNWLRLGGRHQASRAHVLSRLPGLSTFFAESLLPLDAALAEETTDAEPDDGDAAAPVAPPALDLRPRAARADSAHGAHWSGRLRRAIDAGQDRAVIEAIAQRFAVGDNVIRRLWREMPTALGQPPTWRLAQVLRELDALGERDWPTGDAQWRALLARSVPDEAR